MTLPEFASELARPFGDSTVMIGMLAFIALAILAGAAGLFGLWLAIITVPALCRFLLKVMQARIDGRAVEPAGAELFSLVDSLWTYLPIVLVAGGWLVVDAVSSALSPAASILPGIAILMVLPASLGVLGLTHSPAAALNPLLLWRLAMKCGSAYVAAPLAVAIAGGAVVAAARSGAPPWFLQVAEVYILFLLFSMTGAVVAESGVRDEVGIPDPVAPGAEKTGKVLDRERRARLDHAYGLFSRGNRNGGLAHIAEFIERSRSIHSRIDEFDWFFRRMMDWESSEPGLLLGQRYLGALADAGETGRALKILSRCLMAEPRFRPLPEDQESLLEIARSAGRDDLAASLDKSSNGLSQP